MAGFIFHPDRYLPFSLLHIRDDQYRFSVGHPQTMPGSPSGPPSNTGGANPAADPGTVPGFHEQAVFDGTCQPIAVSPSAPHAGGGNVTPHDPTPIYDMNLMLELSRECVKNESYDFWALISHEHQLKVSLTSVESPCSIKGLVWRGLFGSSPLPPCVFQSPAAVHSVRSSKKMMSCPSLRKPVRRDGGSRRYSDASL